MNSFIQSLLISRNIRYNICMLECRELKLLVGGIVMIQFEQLYKEVLPVLQSKMDEINYYEYDGISIEDIWNFCIKKKWKKRNVEEMRLYEMVETIFSVKPSEIVSYFQIQQFRSENWFQDINQSELQALLKPKISDGDK